MAPPVPRIGRARKAHLYIEEWMEYCGLNDEKMAGRIGVDRVTVTRWRNQQHRLNPEKIAKIAHALDIEPAQLWRPPPPPGQPPPPSVDEMLRGAHPDLRQKATELVEIILKTGTR